MAETNTEQIRAVVITGVVDTTILMSDDVLQQWHELGFVEMMWPGATLIDVTNLDPQPSTNWTWDGKNFAAPPEPVEESSATASTEDVSEPVGQTSPATSA